MTSLKVKTIGIGAFVLVVGAVFIAVQYTQKSDHVSVTDLGRLSAGSLTYYCGAPVSLDSFRGKPLVINSWAVWCPFCKQELPDFAALQSEFPDVVVIAIDRAESLEMAKSYTDSLGISESMVFLMDASDDFYKNIGGFSMPETVFIDSGGTIVFHKRGPMTLEEMRATVIQYLQ